MIYMGNTRVGFNALTSLPANPPPPENLVKFRDCDGTVLYAYTPAKIASMEYLPPLPTRAGLTCQGWNWTLPQIKSYAAAYGACEVGATYTTDDGKTRIKIIIQDPKYATIPIVFQQTAANGVKVNWGDGSADQTYSSTDQQTISHTYAPSAYPATYTITFHVTSGTMSFPSYIMGISSQSTTNPRGAFLNMIDEVNIGTGVTSIGGYAFQYCYSLASITISSSVTSIGTYAFRDCYSLASITIPSPVTTISGYMFSSCCSLASITIPNSVLTIGNRAFYSCFSLTSITIPSSVTSIGSNAFNYCASLTSVTIPSSVTNIASYAFYYCYSLVSVTIPSSITSIQNYTFCNCSSLASVTLPSSLTIIGQNAFQSCSSLASITLPSSLTGSYVYSFSSCSSLASIAIPSSLTTISGYMFSSCYGLKTFDFRRSTSVPTLVDATAFSGTPSVKEIVVPDELYDTWIEASNWSLSTNQIKESIVKASESSLGPL